MQNVQVIDGAENCSFSVCRMSDDDFALVFPGPGQDVEFIEDLVTRIGECAAAGVVRRGTVHWLRKPDVAGIHGTLFFGLPGRRKYFPNKQGDDVAGVPFVRSGTTD